MRSQGVGHATHFAAAHRIGLAGDRERCRARFADLAAGEVAVDDGIALVDTTGGLIDPLREERDHPRGVAEPVEQTGNGGFVDATGGGGAGPVGCAGLGGSQCGLETFGVGRDVGRIESVAAGQVGEQSVEQQCIAARGDRQMQVGQVATGGAARVDHHHLQLRSLGLGLDDALIDHRMGPGGVGAGQQNQVSQLQIFIAARHAVAAEGALVGRGGRGHAKTGVGVDVAGADEPLHQLVGDIVVLGQQLAGDVEGHGFWT